MTTTPTNTTPLLALTSEQIENWRTRGYIRIEGFGDPDMCKQMLDRVVEIVNDRAEGREAAGWVLPESNLSGRAGRPEDLVAKVFKLHRDTVFHEFAISDAVTKLVAELIEPDIDCFLSQFIFKNPAAWGQPWHQDSYYFKFDPPRPIVGVWLAVTEATLENGCLHILPGSHSEPIHEHLPDSRPNANIGYVEIRDHDMSASEPVLMAPGDLLLFDSHLMHRSTDNESDGIRAAMVYHYAAAGTTQLVPSPVNDFMPVRRGGETV